MADENVHEPLLIIGAGGHAKVVIDVARAAGWEPAGCLDPSASEPCLGVPVLGGDDRAEALFEAGWRTVALALGTNALRLRIALRLKAIGYALPPIIHPSAVISRTARIGEGTVVMPHATVNPDATVGRAVIINTGATVEHDCIVGDGCHIAPRSVLAGTVRIGTRSLVGVGSVARPGAVVGADIILGAGTVVVGDIPDGPATYFGVPARLAESMRE